MLIIVNSVASYGLESLSVRVEVNVASRGFPSFDIVGLASKAVAESRERVKTAIQNSGFEFPNKKITVNLAPADRPKEGSFFDLPIAVGILAAVSKIPIDNSMFEDSMFFGELSLDGGLRHTRGVLLVALHAKESGIKNLFVPAKNAAEAVVVDGLAVYGVSKLVGMYEHITGSNKIRAADLADYRNIKGAGSEGDMLSEDEDQITFDDIIGQSSAKRALEIAVAGGHNILMTGPPGVGKTLLAKALPSILPPLTFEESLEVTKIYSSAGLLKEGQSLITKPPVRTPHHTSSFAGMIGGGSIPRAGEISLAHRGVLFLDEFPEFSRRVVESLRQPLEDGIVTISRSIGSVTFPTSFILVAAANPCPCGYRGSSKRNCNCTQYQISHYNNKISGAVLDRIDLQIKLSNIDTKEISYKGHKRTGSKSVNEIKNRIIQARKIQEKRYKNVDVNTNSKINTRQMSKYCIIDSRSQSILDIASERFSFTTRTYFKIIKVAQTIADLKSQNPIRSEHVAEAIQYRTAEAKERM